MVLFMHEDTFSNDNNDRLMRTIIVVWKASYVKNETTEPKRKK